MDNKKTKTILLVEDDPFMVEIYSIKLKEMGFSVKPALDGQEALKKLEEDMPDLVLLDIVLPNMDGWELLKRIKKEERFKDLKVDLLSNLGQKPEIEKGMELGAVKYIIKAHHTPSEVAAQIKELLG